MALSEEQKAIIERNQKIGETWYSLMELDKVWAKVKDSLFDTEETLEVGVGAVVKYSDDSTIRNTTHGDWEYSRKAWDAIPNAGLMEWAVSWALMPDAKAEVIEIFPSVEGLMVHVLYMGTYLDTPRTRSLGVAGKRVTCSEFNVMDINEAGEITRLTLTVSGQGAYTNVPFMDWNGDWMDDGSQRDGYDEAVKTLQEQGQICDPQVPIKPRRGHLPWYANGEFLELKDDYRDEYAD